MAYPGYPNQPPHVPGSAPPYPTQSAPYPGMPPAAGYDYQPPAGPYPNAPYPGAPAMNPMQTGYPQGYAPPPSAGFAPYPTGAPAGYAPYPAGAPGGPAPYPAGYPSGAYPGGAPMGYPPQHGVGVAHAHQPTQAPQVVLKTFTPTIRPKVPYGPSEEEADASALRKAMKGLGTDEKAVIAIISKRTNQQRQLISRRFKVLYGKDLTKELKGELGGKFRDVVMACMTPMDQFYAEELHDAMAGVGTNEATLVEILCSLNNGWILAIKNAYQLKYKKSLESDIKGDTSFNFSRLLTSLCQGMRDENPHVNPAQVTTDVQTLYAAGQSKKGTDEAAFHAILVTRSLPHLRAVFQEYQQTHKTPFEKVIKSEFSGSIKDGLEAIVKCMTNCSEYFAERLHASMARVGTNDRALIRLIITRSECDLGDIKISFQQKYNKSLESFIESDCSGDYKKMLISMVAGN